MKKRVFFECNCIVFFAFFIGIAIFMIKDIWPFGNNTVIWADMTNTTPLYYYLYDALKGNDSLFFTWRFGCGLETLGIISQQGMLSPVNLLLLLFKREDIYGAIGILVIVKMALMSGAMYFYLFNYKVTKWLKIAGAMAYATGMSVLVQQPIVMTLDIAILFPILMWSYEEGLAGRKNHLYPICLALCFIVNFYMSVMICFYLIIVTGVYVIKEKEDKKQKIFYLFIGSLESLAFSAIIWIPVLYNFINSSRLTVNENNTYLTAINTFSLPDQGWLIFINLSLFIALIICNLVKNSNKSNTKVVCKGCIFLLLVLAAFIPSIELLWHMGSHSGWSWRFGFIFQFVLIDFAVVLQQNQTEKRHIIEKKWIQVAVTIITVIGLVLFIIVYKQGNEFSVIDKVILYCVCILVGIYSLIFYFARGCVRRMCFVLTFGIEILVNCLVWFAPDWQNRQDCADMKYIYDSIAIGEEISQSENRWIKTKDWDGCFASNYAAVMNVNSIANWIHLVEKNQQETFKTLGYSVNYTRFLDNGGTIFSDIILGYRNAFASKDIDSNAWIKEKTIENFNWYTMKYQCPLIWSLNEEDINNIKKIENKDVFSYQNELFQAFTGKNRDILFEEIDVDSLISQHKMEIHFNNDSELYLFGTGTEQFSISIDGESVLISNLTDDANVMYPAPFNNGIVDLGYYKKGEECNIELQFEDINVESGKIHLATMDTSLLEKRITQISNNEIDYELNFKNNGVNIKVSNVKIKNNKEYIFLPVLYDDGWTCYINGEKVKTQNLNGLLLIPIIDSNMDIKLKFYPKGVKEGIYFFLLAQFVVLIELILYKHYSKIAYLNTQCMVYLGIIAFYMILYIVPLIYFIKHMILH